MKPLFSLRFLALALALSTVLFLAFGSTYVFAVAGTVPKSPVLTVFTSGSSGTDTALVWVPPVSNTDGSAPAKIGGYNVYRSLSSQIVTQQNGGAKPLAGGPGAAIEPGTLTYLDKGTATAAYYYAVSAWWCDSVGCSEGDLSNVVAAGGAKASMNLTWIAPTTNTDGSAITSVEPLTYTVYGGSLGGTLVKVADGITGTSYVDAGKGPCYAVTATALGNESSRSAQVCTLTPTTPAVKLAAIGGTAYMELRSKDALVVLPVGTVPAGTACDPKNAVFASGSGFYLVPAASVTFSGSLKPLAVFASCQ